jgi:hypothetical protein
MGPLLPLLFALATAGAPSPEPIEISHAERLVVVAPHPDDETLGAGGLMQRVLASATARGCVPAGAYSVATAS